IIFGLFEGQGRILMGYHPIFRILFDGLLLLGVLKVFLNKKKIFDRKVLPSYFYILMALHFFWWCFQLFNPLAAGVLPSFATSKYYIFPFFLFLAFTLDPMKIESEKVNRFIIVLMFVMLLQAILCIVQMLNGQPFMNSISTNYSNLFEKFKEFSGFRFRPWGTSHTPGGMSLFFYLTLPLILLIDFGKIKKAKTKLFLKIIFPLFIIVSWTSLFISQVRSAWIKHILISLATGLIYFIATKYKVRKLASYVFTVTFVLVSGCLLVVNSSDIGDKIDLLSSIERIEELRDQGVLTQRAGPGEIIKFLIERTRFPLGFGPGMTTGYLPHYERRRQELIEIPKYHFWSMDNFFAFIILEMGVGAIFYFGSLFSIVAIVSARTMRLYKEKNFFYLQKIGAVFVGIVIILLGNWGAVGIPFNPESFYFWIYCAIGIQVYQASREQNEPKV
ncbi:MAG: hypothetical protein ACPGJV_13930, partial [Bacteriovoracaceae bacterium]